VKVAGFSFVRNAIKYDYPIIEAITSILPICDEFIVAVGNSEDDTLKLIKSIASDKIKIIETIWDDSLREGGQVLAKETDKAIHAISSDIDWAFYIQGDEVVHEKYLDEIKNSMLKWKDDKSVDGLLFNYRHFYGSYDYVADAPNWYRKEIRVIRPSQNIYSYKDAQGFRKNENKVFGHVESELKRRFKAEKTPDDMYQICKTDNNYWKHYRHSENLDPDAVSLVLCKDSGCDLMYCQALAQSQKQKDKNLNLYGCSEQYNNFRECYIKEKRRFNFAFPEDEWLSNRQIIPNYIEKQLLILKEQKERLNTFGEGVKVIKLDNNKLVDVKKTKMEMEEGYYD
jgi:hypothetical protein